MHETITVVRPNSSTVLSLRPTLKDEQYYFVRWLFIGYIWTWRNLGFRSYNLPLFSNNLNAVWQATCKKEEWDLFSLCMYLNGYILIFWQPITSSPPKWMAEIERDDIDMLKGSYTGDLLLLTWYLCSPTNHLPSFSLTIPVKVFLASNCLLLTILVNSSCLDTFLTFPCVELLLI